MNFLTTATLNWFDDGCCDVRYLDIWAKEPLSYHQDAVVGSSWQHDFYEQLIGYDTTGHLFQAAVDALLTYNFYPKSIMAHTSDFSLNNRLATVGDRIVQRIHVLRFFKRPFLDVIGLTEVTHVSNTARLASLTYATVRPHAVEGEWRAVVDRREDDLVWLTIRATSRPKPAEPSRNHGYMRAFQKFSHQEGIRHFVAQVKTAVSQPA